MDSYEGGGGSLLGIFGDSDGGFGGGGILMEVFGG